MMKRGVEIRRHYSQKLMIMEFQGLKTSLIKGIDSAGSIAIWDVADKSKNAMDVRSSKARSLQVSFISGWLRGSELLVSLTIKGFRIIESVESAIIE